MTTRHFIQQLAAAMLLLVAGTSAAWADYSGVELTSTSYVWDKTITDDGGGME